MTLLRIVVWNCNRGLHKKLEFLSDLRPDIAVIPECAEPDTVRRKAPDATFTDADWIGEYKDRGLGVFTFGSYSLNRHPQYDPDHYLFLPVEIKGAVRLNLLAVWAFEGRTPKRAVPNPAPTRAAVNAYANLFGGSAPGIAAGDFNANHRWDKPGRAGNHFNLVERLSQLGMTSAYHAVRNEAFGEEKEHTHFLYRSAERLYHIDYCYIPKAWQTGLRSVTIGPVHEWQSRSDHAPVIVELELPTEPVPSQPTT